MLARQPSTFLIFFIFRVIMETNWVLERTWTTLMNQLLWCNLVVLGFYNVKAYFSLSVVKLIEYYKQNDNRVERKNTFF
jgi:hypothetical protein